jgi:hypothetical protein
MPAASIDLTAKNTYGDNYGNFAETNTLPWSGWTRARHIKTSAIGGAGGNGACATVGYKIMTIPSFTLITKVMGLVHKSASATMSAFAIGDADASTTWIADMSGTALGPPTMIGVHGSFDVGMSIFGGSQLFNGKYYSNGGEIQFAATTSEKTLEFMVVVEGVTFSPA